MNDRSKKQEARSKKKLVGALLLVVASYGAAQTVETRPLTLGQAIDLALRQNPDYLLARLEEDKARHAVREARAPFVPRLTAGSGLAYSSGFPLSIEGSAPSIVQAQGAQHVFNRPQTFRVREAREMAGAASHATAGKGDEIAWRVAAVYLDFERAARAAGSLRRHLDTLERIERLVADRVEAGRDIRLELSRARVETARARNQLRQLEAHAEQLEETLRADLALEAGVRIRPVESEITSSIPLPSDAGVAVASALAASPEIKRLESVQQASRYRMSAEQSARLPRVDLVAQYAVLGRFNNYEDFFRTFKRHNGQFGVSFQLPLFSGSQISSRVAQVEVEIAQGNLRLAAARAGVTLESRRLYREVEQADAARELARLELDLARESLSVMLARLDEGRVDLRQVEQARVVEFQKWEALYDSQTAATRARLNLLRQTGGLLAALSSR